MSAPCRPSSPTAVGALAPPANPGAARGEESLLQLLQLLFEALFYWLQQRTPPALVRFGVAVCGLYALATPLLLWISWSLEVLVAVLGLFLLSIAAILALIWLNPEDHF